MKEIGEALPTMQNAGKGDRYDSSLTMLSQT